MSDTFPFLIYRSAEQDISLNAVIRDETVWLTQKAMAELFGVEIPAISKHLANIFAEGELEAEATLSKMEIVQQEGSGTTAHTVAPIILDETSVPSYALCLVKQRHTVHTTIKTARLTP